MNGVYRDSDGFLLRAGYTTFVAGAGETVRTDVPDPAYTVTSLDDAGKAYKWDGDAWILDTPPVVPVQHVLCWDEGEYTGDGSTGFSVTGLPCSPKYLKIVIRETTSGNAVEVWETWGRVIDDDAAGMSILHRNADTPPHEVIKDAIVSLDADGFTVSDQGADKHPNKNTVKYNWYVIGF